MINIDGSMKNKAYKAEAIIIIREAYRHWMKGQRNNWLYASPYMCDNINYVSAGPIANDLCRFISSKVGMSVQSHLSISDEDGAMEAARHPDAMAFRLGFWYGLAERFGFDLVEVDDGH